MHHVAIMNKSWNLIPKILSGEKSIESRWYQTKRTPWNKAKSGDIVFFKNAGEPIIATAVVGEIKQFEIHGINDVLQIVEKYGQKICLVNPDPKSWKKLARYCILLSLQIPTKIDTPFQINKKGFGTGAAWITIQDVGSIKVPA